MLSAGRYVGIAAAIAITLLTTAILWTLKHRSDARAHWRLELATIVAADNADLETLFASWDHDLYPAERHLLGSETSFATRQAWIRQVQSRTDSRSTGVESQLLALLAAENELVRARKVLITSRLHGKLDDSVYQRNRTVEAATNYGEALETAVGHEASIIPVLRSIGIVSRDVIAKAAPSERAYVKACTNRWWEDKVFVDSVRKALNELDPKPE